MKRNFKKLNIILLVLVLSFLSLLLISCKDTDSKYQPNYPNNDITPETVIVRENNTYFYTDLYFGGSNLDVLIGKYDPTINKNKQKAMRLLSHIAGLNKKIEGLADSHGNFSNGEKYNAEYINNNVGKKIEIDEYLYNLLEITLILKQKTNGHFDISIGHIVDEWKKIINGTADKSIYINEENFNNKISEIKSMEVNNDEDAIKLYEEESKYYVKIQENVKIDLGGIAKGYIVDLISTYLDDEGVTDYIVRGSDSSLKYGKNKYDSNGVNIGDYKIGISNAHLGYISPYELVRDDNDKPIEDENGKPIFANFYYRYGDILVNSTSVTTSGDTHQSEQLYGRLLHHIISPIKKEPLTHNRLLTIVHPNATIADALSTAMFLMSEKELSSFIKSPFAIENNIEDYIIFKAEKKDVDENFVKTEFSYNDLTWDYPGSDDLPPSGGTGDDILKKTTRDFIIISVVVIIATLGFIMFADAFKKKQGNVTHVTVVYNSNEELVKVDFRKREVSIIADQSDASGYPKVDLENKTITILGAKQPQYEKRHDVVIRYDFEKRSMMIVSEESPENTCTKQGETFTGRIDCLPNKVSVKFHSSKEDDNSGLDGIV